MRQHLLKLLIVLGLLAVLASCYSLIESAVEGAVATETEEAISESNGDNDQKSVESAGSGKVGDHNIVGAWVNPEYNDEGRSARVVYSLNSDGTYTYLAFDRVDGSGAVYEGTVEYLKTWIDEEGRSCGQCIVTLNNGMSWETLDRIGADGSTLEVQSGVRKINPKGARYSIYYRP
jgi:hypothetical protein